MTPQAFLLGVLVSTLIGALFHLWRGGKLSRLLLYLGLSWLGFWSGHLLAGELGWRFAAVGPLNLGMAVLVAVIILGIGYWLSLVKVERK